MKYLNNMKQFFNHIYWFIRYGEWHCGWELWEDKPMFGVYRTYYDGIWFNSLHIWKLWIDVVY